MTETHAASVVDIGCDMPLSVSAGGIVFGECLTVDSFCLKLFKVDESPVKTVALNF